MRSVRSTTILKRHFARKKKDFAGFSTRWLAQRLEVSPSYISQIMNGKRTLPPKLVDPLCYLLDVDTEDHTRICRELLTKQGWKKPSPDSRSGPKEAGAFTDPHWDVRPTKQQHLLTSWYYVSILEATLLTDYDGSTKFIGRRLGLPETMVKEAMEVLIENGCIEEIDGKFRKTSNFFEFASLLKKDEIRAYHSHMMQKAISLMENRKDAEALEQRLITSATLTCSREHIPALKAKLADLLKEFVEGAAEAPPEEVYHLALQFIPISQLPPKGR